MFTELIGIWSDNHTEQVNVLRGQN